MGEVSLGFMCVYISIFLNTLKNKLWPGLAVCRSQNLFVMFLIPCGDQQSYEKNIPH